MLYISLQTLTDPLVNYICSILSNLYKDITRPYKYIVVLLNEHRAGDSIQLNGKRLVGHTSPLLLPISYIAWYIRTSQYPCSFSFPLSLSLSTPSHSARLYTISWSLSPSMHKHLGLNLGTAGPSWLSSSSLPSPPKTQQQQHQQAVPSQYLPPLPPPAVTGAIPPMPAGLPASNIAPPALAPPPSNSIPGPLPAAPIAPNPSLPVIHVAPAAGRQVLAQQTAEIAALCTRLGQLEATRQLLSQAAVAPAPASAPPVLFVPPDAVNRARAAALATWDSDKKLLLPKIIPGFKASSLDIREYSPPSFSATVGVQLHWAKGLSVIIGWAAISVSLLKALCTVPCTSKL